MTKIRLREATVSDAAALGRVHVQAWRETYTGLLPDAMLDGMSQDKRQAMWAQILGSGATGVWVAERDGAVIGFGSCGPQRNADLASVGFDGEISAIYVLAAHQRLGAGQRLMAAMAGHLYAAGGTGMALWVLRENDPARAFYERIGGHEVAERRDEREDGVLFEIAYGWRFSAQARPPA